MAKTEKMKASKEAAREARSAVKRVVAAARLLHAYLKDDDLDLIYQFLDVAEKKLPSEKAYKADAKRKRGLKALMPALQQALKPRAWRKTAKA